MAVRNLVNDVPDEAVDELLESCSKNRGVFRNILNGRPGNSGKKNLKEVIFTHQSPKGKKIHNFETKELVLGSLAKFSDKFYKFGKELIEGSKLIGCRN